MFCLGVSNLVSLNWDHLRFFLALANEHTLVAAAQSLNVSHTTVLRKIRLIEESLDVKLFEHTGDGHRLSVAGETLYAETVELNKAIGKVTRQITDSQRNAYGEVVITTTDTLAYEILPELLESLSAQHNGLRFSLKMINRRSDIDNYEADIAIRACREPPADLIGRQLGNIQFAACASAHYLRPRGLTQFPDNSEGHRFIVLDSSYKSTPFYSWLDDRLSSNSHCTVASSFLCAAALCCAGMGITILPDYMLKTRSDLVQLPTDEPISSNPLWILSHPDSRDTERVKLVRRFLYDALVQRFGSGST